MDASFLIIDGLILFIMFLLSSKFPRKFAKLITFLPVTVALCMFNHGPLKTAYTQVVELIVLTKRTNPNDTKIKDGDLYISYVYSDSVSIGYPVGQYKLSDVPYAEQKVENSLISVKFFCDSLNIPYENVEICIVATADGIPTKKSYYNGNLGNDILMEYEDINGLYHSLHLQKGVTPMRNIEYAGSRAYPVKEQCEKHFGQNNPNIKTVLHCFEKPGQEYRKVTVCFRVKNIYTPYTRELNKLFIYALKKANIRT